jgi:hypothetical protein
MEEDGQLSGYRDGSSISRSQASRSGQPLAITRRDGVIAADTTAGPARR